MLAGQASLWAKRNFLSLFLFPLNGHSAFPQKSSKRFKKPELRLKLEGVQVLICGCPIYYFATAALEARSDPAHEVREVGWPCYNLVLEPC